MSLVLSSGINMFLSLLRPQIQGMFLSQALGSESGYGVGGSSVFVLLSLVNKETALSLVIGQDLGRWGDRTKFWEEESRDREPLGRHQVRHAESFLENHDLVVNTD